MKSLSVLFSVIIVVAFSSSAWAAKRVALVLGNANYESTASLKNPINDATDMTGLLERMEFTVVGGEDLSLDEMRGKIQEFLALLPGSDIALLYYAGHGVQAKGQNYLIPIDARLKSEDELGFEALPLDLIVTAMERNSGTNLVFLDACRDNPLAELLVSSRSGGASRGLARVESGVGTMVSFSTAPGAIALDGDGRNSPYTQALLKHLATPNLDIAQIMRRVRTDVLQTTDRKQVPWEVASLTADVVLTRDDKPLEEVSPTVVMTPAAPEKRDDLVRIAVAADEKAGRSVFFELAKQYPSLFEGRELRMSGLYEISVYATASSLQDADAFCQEFHATVGKCFLKLSKQSSLEYAASKFKSTLSDENPYEGFGLKIFFGPRHKSYEKAEAAIDVYKKKYKQILRGVNVSWTLEDFEDETMYAMTADFQNSVELSNFCIAAKEVNLECRGRNDLDVVRSSRP